MKAASIEEDIGRSQDLDHRAIMNGGFENHHLGPKTRETELRLGLSGSGLETLENEKKEDRWFLGQSCFLQNQWNGGVGYGVRAKRVFSDAMIGAQEAREVYGNGWNLGFMGAGEAGRNMVINNIRKPTGFSLNETVKDGISDEKQKVPFEKNRKAEAHSPPDTRLVFLEREREVYCFIT
ncbi:hypothetical protein AMTR_s00071p00169030 [Amborella trichopoda]|uniref:Uncharacterized protein n=1 Tax=Amborella trichopoda TaxID=13333 RepID=U5DF16_AMBTC|nr:hypothetical protein AMTR_s00071p00169030 [Amborella trichopoda]